MGEHVKVPALPDCDICKHPTYGTGAKAPARFDFRTLTGQWANACAPHYLEWRSSPMLGTGRGQLLLLEGETALEVWKQVMAEAKA